MLITAAPDSPVSRCAAHLLGAVELADARARADTDDLLSPWAIVAHAVSLAEAGLSLHLNGPVLPAQHPDCLAALRVASTELAGVRAGIDLPLAELADVLVLLSDAARHARALDEPAPADAT